MDECTALVGNATLLRLWTLKSGIGKLKLSEKKGENIVYVSPLHHLFWRHAFWIEKCPMDVSPREGSFTEVILRFPFVGFEDIVVLSWTPDEHTDHLRPVWTSIQNADVKLSLNKCESFTTCIVYYIDLFPCWRPDVSTHMMDDMGRLQHFPT